MKSLSLARAGSAVAPAQRIAPRSLRVGSSFGAGVRRRGTVAPGGYGAVNFPQRLVNDKSTREAV